MAIAPNEVQALIEGEIQGAQVAVQDLTGTQDHYKVVVVSDEFDGKTLIERHQMINKALSEPLKGPLHALTIEAYTDAQWSEKRAQQAQVPQGIKW